MSSVNNDLLFLKRIDGVINTYGLQMVTEQKEKLLEYLGQLNKWNKTYNLTAIRNQEQALVQHVFDSLSVVKPILECMQQQKIACPKIMDVGSGGGLPGVVLAITLPEASVICVDAVDKKMAFIRHIAAVLQLKNLKAVHARIEELPPAEMNVVTSRAFASLKDFAELSGKHVATGGEFVAMKGKHPADEIVELEKTEWQVQKIETLTVPELDAERCLVWMQRKDRK